MTKTRRENGIGWEAAGRLLLFLGSAVPALFIAFWIIAILVLFPGEHPFEPLGKFHRRFDLYMTAPLCVALGAAAGLCLSFRADRNVRGIGGLLFALGTLAWAACVRSDPDTFWPLWTRELLLNVSAFAVCRYWPSSLRSRAAVTGP